MPIKYEHNLGQEHKSRALLIKLGWILIAGLCSIFISVLSWSEHDVKAYATAKIGVGLWLIAAVAIVVSTHNWLQKQQHVAHGSVSANSLTIGLVTGWLTVLLGSWLGSEEQWQLRIPIDAISWLAAFALVVTSNRMLVAKRSTRRPIFFMVAKAGWLLSAMSFVVAAWFWFRSGARASAAYILVLAMATLGVFIFCQRLDLTSKDLQQEGNEGDKTDRSGDLNPNRELLNLVCQTMNQVAWTFSGFFVFSLVFAAIVAEKATGASVSTTVVTALLGLIASAVSMRIYVTPIFSDKLRVFSSKAGTQYVFPVEILLLDHTTAAIKEIDTRFKTPQKIVGRK